jgi:hypothetical protein
LLLRFGTATPVRPSFRLSSARVSCIALLIAGLGMLVTQPSQSQLSPAQSSSVQTQGKSWTPPC